MSRLLLILSLLPGFAPEHLALALVGVFATDMSFRIQSIEIDAEMKAGNVPADSGDFIVEIHRSAFP